MSKVKSDPIYRKNELSIWVMGLLAIFVGAISGFGALFFRYMIGVVHNLFFLDKFSFFYDANVHTPPGPWGWYVIFIPVIGAIIVVFLVKNFAIEAKGHGVPEVMDAVYRKKGKIRPIVAVVKSVASAVSIGTGGSVGREGPIVQIGSSFGSLLGQMIKMPVNQRNILIAAGASGGIAATFNTPFGGLIFGIELLLVSINAATLFPVIIATVTATYISRTFLGATPAFLIPSLLTPNFTQIPLQALLVFIPFGILVGFCSVVFVRGLYIAEDFFNGMKGNYYTRHITGMFCVGIMMYLMMKYTGHYYVEGVGYSSIVNILNHVIMNPWFLLLLVVTKLLATFLTLGSGASGGIFSPSLFLGAAFGAAIAMLINTFVPGLHIEPVIFALAGMAGMVSATTGAVLTGMIMLIEMVHNLHFALPVMITVGAAYAVRKLFSPGSIYTLKLARRGIAIPEGLQAAVSVSMHADNIMTKAFSLVTKSELKKNPESYLKKKRDQVVIVRRKEVILGILDKTQNLTPERIVNDLDSCLDKNFLLFQLKDSFPEIESSLKEREAHYGLVMSRFGSYKATNIIGVISEKEILNSSAYGAKLLQ